MHECVGLRISESYNAFLSSCWSIDSDRFGSDLSDMNPLTKVDSYKQTHSRDKQGQTDGRLDAWGATHIGPKAAVYGPGELYHRQTSNYCAGTRTCAIVLLRVLSVTARSESESGYSTELCYYQPDDVGPIATSGTTM